MKGQNYYRYTVASSDTLPRIAVRFNCSVSELKMLNKFTTEYDLYGKSSILIPVTDKTQLPREEGEKSEQAKSMVDVSNACEDCECIEKIDKILGAQYNSESDRIKDLCDYDHSLSFKDKESLFYIPDRNFDEHNK